MCNSELYLGDCVSGGGGVISVFEGSLSRDLIL